jgi:hypothetical protein
MREKQRIRVVLGAAVLLVQATEVKLSAMDWRNKEVW